MRKSSLILGTILATAPGLTAAQAAVQVDASHLVAPREMNEVTRNATVRDYLESWQAMSDALAQNRADLLDADFVGTARDRLANGIQQQAELGITTRYQDRSHSIRLLFYSPEGLSAELEDTAEYDVQVFDHGKLLTTSPQHASYIVLLTPSETRWRVRVLQASSDEPALPPGAK
jgi:hypothetical protein